MAKGSAQIRERNADGQSVLVGLRGQAHVDGWGELSNPQV